MSLSIDGKEDGIEEVKAGSSGNSHGTKSIPIPERKPDNQNSKIGKTEIKPYWAVIVRLLISVLLALGILGLIKGYKRKGALTKIQKYTFNTVNILLCTLLSLNITATYAHTVRLIRRGIKNKYGIPSHWTTLTKFDKIGGFRHTVRFLFRIWFPKTVDDGTCSTVNDRTGGTVTPSFFILVWVIFDLGVTIAVALLGLTYSLEEGAIGRGSGSVW
ncbi:hypothetical protein BDZ91DRAFT_853177, partial [Kalaharituber pfeilii]